MVRSSFLFSNSMKKVLAVAAVLLLFGSRGIQSQDALSQAAALAAQRDAEERYKRLSAEVQNLVEAQEGMQKRHEELRQRIDRIADDIRSLKEEISRNSGSLVSREEFKRYVEKLKEVDEKREADKKVILDNIKELAKAPLPAPSEPKPQRRSNESNAPSSSAPEDGYYVYVVKKNNRLSDIVTGYNEQFQKEGRGKISMDDLLKANPSIKEPNLLRTGQKIRIPIPPKDSK